MKAVRLKSSGQSVGRRIKLTGAVILKTLQKKSRRSSSKDVLPELSEVLHNLKPSEFKDKYLSRYKVFRLYSF